MHFGSCPSALKEACSFEQPLCRQSPILTTIGFMPEEAKVAQSFSVAQCMQLYPTKTITGHEYQKTSFGARQAAFKTKFDS